MLQIRRVSAVMALYRWKMERSVTMETRWSQMAVSVSIDSNARILNGTDFPSNGSVGSYCLTCLLNCTCVSQSADMRTAVMAITTMELRSVTEKTLDIKPATLICLGKIQFKHSVI